MVKRILGILVLVVPTLTLINFFVDIKDLWWAIDYYSIVFTTIGGIVILRDSWKS
ncbi:MAG: hypothetical protein AAB066_05940 [Candidatus Margulisiibacteriota bacterium]